MSKCVNCAYIVSHSKAMAKAMYSGCQHRPEWEYRAVNAERECNLFQPASESEIEKRKAWIGRDDHKS